MNHARRLQRIETSLTPKQAVLFWLKEAQQIGIVESIDKEFKRPAHEAPRARLTEMVGKAVRESLCKQGMKLEQKVHAERDARIQTDFLFVLMRDLHRDVSLECMLQAPYTLLLYEKFGRMLEHYTQRVPKFAPEVWEMWRAVLIQRLRSMRQLRETVAAISEEYFDGHPLLFPEDANTLDQENRALEKLTKHYNSLKGCLPAFAGIDLNAQRSSIREQLLEKVAERVANAKSTTLRDFGEEERAWKLVEPHALAALKRLRASRDGVTS